jgi:hypothetical protein
MARDIGGYCPLDQKKSFRPNCMSRGIWEVSVTVPKAVEDGVVLGAEN